MGTQMPAEPSTEPLSRRKGTEPCIRLFVPLPPAALRGNSRAHWTQRKRAADEYSLDVWKAWNLLYNRPGQTDYWPIDDTPYRAAAVEYDWHYAGARPDLDNVARSVKVLQDTLCCCPADFARRLLGDAYGDRYFLGLIEDDGGIEPVTFKRTRVRHKADECVKVTIWRLQPPGS